MPTPKGWYPDPKVDVHLRFWNGDFWTSHVRVEDVPENASNSYPESRFIHLDHDSEDSRNMVERWERLTQHNEPRLADDVDYLDVFMRFGVVCLALFYVAMMAVVSWRHYFNGTSEHSMQLMYIFWLGQAIAFVSTWITLDGAGKRGEKFRVRYYVLATIAIDIYIFWLMTSS